jgi:cytosine/adenosine deaminase-related metal-dependent hydrolase
MFAALTDRRYSRKMIVRARIVVTMNGPPIDDGAVRVMNGRIAEVGKISEVASANHEILDLGECILLPGLINAHCHLDYTCLRGKIPRQKSFTNWIRAINAEKAGLTVQDYVASINAGLAEARRFGTTTIANLTAFPELIASIDEAVQTWWFAELIDVREPKRADEIADTAVESLKRSNNWGLAPHAPFTASTNLFRRSQEIALRENTLLTTHLAESREEMEMFRDRSGPLFEFLQSLGRSMDDCGGTTPLETFLRGLQLPRGDPSIQAGWAVSLQKTAPWVIAHLNELTESDFALLSEIRRKFSIAHCPRSHAYFRHSDFQFRTLQQLGFNICLGTDSLASNDDLSLFAEMRAFHKRFPAWKPEKTLEMVTVNSARALRREHELGKISPNFLADMIGIPFRDSSAVYQTILNFVDEVPWIMLHGKITDTY